MKIDKAIENEHGKFKFKSSLTFSISGCTCYDFYWIWLFNDVSKEIWSQCRFPEHVGCCNMSSMGNTRNWIFSYARGRYKG